MASYTGLFQTIFSTLVAAYVGLARQEEKVVTEEFGEPYLEYARQTPRFLPIRFTSSA
ncbi:hypothetical protein IH970_01055 [candidate division KSB1 bacterium]|nr:hypothetical protein [candidate division KSB1 bacterium]